MPATGRGAQTVTMHTLRNIHALQWAMAACGAASMLSAHLGALGAYATFKPLTMVLALMCVWWLTRASRYPIARWLLLLGLLLSMVGDVSLLSADGFVPGLGAFLLAHLAYLGMLRRDSPRWLPHTPALLACATAGALLYAYLWQHGLPSTLRLPVLAYVGVIATMASQALGRATALRTPAAWCVAAGALSFMLSDSLLAFDLFVQPLPNVYLWVLGSYYLAQWLIVHGMLAVLRPQAH